MPYRSSKARKVFEGQIDYLKRVVSKAFSKKEGISDPDCRQFILGQAIILSSAKFEEYIQDIITGFFHKVNANGIQTQNLPKALRAFLLNDETAITAYRNFMLVNDEDRLLQSIASMIGNNKFTFMLDGVAAPTIIAGRIYSGVRYPSSKNILRLFKRLGIKNIFHEINRSSRSDLMSKLESFNDIRTEIAHIGRLIGKNDKDVKDLLEDYKLIIAHIDRVFCKHACKISSLFCWPA